jgi:hypothetical protein
LQRPDHATHGQIEVARNEHRRVWPRIADSSQSGLRWERKQSKNGLDNRFQSVKHR